jgi:hypothetical protein
MIVGILDIRKTGTTVASIENILHFSECIIVILSFNLAPSLTSVSEVIVVFVYIVKERTAIIEKTKQIKGIINPSHLFCFLERKICNQMLPARNTRNARHSSTTTITFAIYLTSLYN